MIKLTLTTATLLLALAVPGAGQSANPVVKVIGGSFDGGDGRPATTSHLLIPNRARFLSDGSLLIGDTIGGANLRRVTPDGVIQTFARLNVPQTVLSIAEGPDGVVYASTSSFLFRVKDGKAERVAGTGRVASTGNGGPAIQASLNGCVGLVISPSGEIFFAEAGGNRVRKIKADGTVEAVAGTGAAGSSGDGGLATAATLNTPQDIAMDAAGVLYIADFGNQRIRTVGTDGVIRAFAGNPQGPANLVDRSRTGIYFSGVVDIHFDPNGRLVVADSGWDRIFRLEGERFVSLAGGGTVHMAFPENIPAGQAGLAIIGSSSGPNGSIAFTDIQRHMIGRVQDGVVTRIAGRERPDREGKSAVGTLMRPSYVTQDKLGNVYVSEGPASMVRRITPEGIITTVAGDGVSRTRGDGGPARAASLQTPGPLAVDADGNLFIADNGARLIRRVSALDGTIQTFAGNGRTGNTGDGGAAVTASFGNLVALAFDGSGNLLLLDSTYSVVRRVLKDGKIERVAGTGGAGFSGDGGKATSAQLRGPLAMAVDGLGNIYVADSGNFRIRKISIDGTISHVAGIGVRGDPVVGGIPELSPLGDVMSMAIDSAGTVYLYSRTLDRKTRIFSIKDGRIGVFAGTGDYPAGWDDVMGASQPAETRIGEVFSMHASAAGDLVFTDNFDLVRRVAAPTAKQ